MLAFNLQIPGGQIAQLDLYGHTSFPPELVLRANNRQELLEMLSRATYMLEKTGCDVGFILHRGNSLEDSISEISIYHEFDTKKLYAPVAKGVCLQVCIAGVKGCVEHVHIFLDKNGSSGFEYAKTIPSK